jgi:hypothetical protein
MLLEWLEALPPASLLQRSGIAYMLVNAAHIASFGLLVGSIVSLDVRLLGAFKHMPLRMVGPFLSRMAGIGLALAVTTGAWLFIVDPREYVNNPVFLVKIGLVAVGVANALWLHAARAWRLAVQDDVVSIRLRGHAAISILTWLSVVLAGRWIAFW